MRGHLCLIDGSAKLFTEIKQCFMYIAARLLIVYRISKGFSLASSMCVHKALGNKKLGYEDDARQVMINTCKPCVLSN